VVAADGTLVVGLLPAIAGDLALSLAAVGQTVTVFAAVYAVSAPLLAFASHRISAKGVLLGSLGVFAMSNVVTGLAPNLAVLLAGRVLAAAAAAMFMPAASVAAAAVSALVRRGRALSVVVSGAAAGIALGVPAGIWIGSWSSWRTAFLLLAALAVVAAAAVALIVPTLELPPRPRQASRLLDRRSLRVLLVTGIWAFGSFTFFTYVSLVLRRAAHISGGLLALFLLLYGVCGVAGSIAAGRFSDRAGARATLVVALTLIAAALIGLGVLTVRGGGGGAAVLCACAGLLALYAAGTWSVTPPQQHRLIGLGGEPRLVLGLNASVLYAGVALGGAAGGMIVGSGGGAATLCWVAAAIELTALAVLQVPDSLFARKKAGRPAAPPAHPAREQRALTPAALPRGDRDL